MPDGSDLSAEERDWAMDMLKADQEINQITSQKARILDGLMRKIKKIEEILTGGLNKRGKRY